MELSNEATSRVATFLDAGYAADVLLDMAREDVSLDAIADEAKHRIWHEISGDDLIKDLAEMALASVDWQEIAQLFIDEMRDTREAEAIEFGEYLAFNPNADAPSLADDQ